MPERRLVVWPSATQDVVEISTRIALDDPRAAERFEAAVSNEYEMVRRYPHSGRPRGFRSRALRGLRSRPLTRFSSWLVFYRVEQNVVEIVRVVHGARNLPRALKERLPPP